MLTLNDVTFGDVWICSGQSNMGWALLGIDNKDEEVERLKEFPNIKMFRLARMTSETPQDDLIELEYEKWNGKWVSTSDSDLTKRFSAICVLTASYMAEVLGKNKVFQFTLLLL